MVRCFFEPQTSFRQGFSASAPRLSAHGDCLVAHVHNWALSENLTERPFSRNFLHPLNREEPTLVTAIRLAGDERHRGRWFERDAEGAGLRLNWAGHGERLDEGVGIPGISGLSAGDRRRA